MHGRLGDAAAVAAHLVGKCADVPVLSVEFFWSMWFLDEVPGGPKPVGEHLRTMEARVHACSWAGAQTVAARFGLVEVDGEYARYEFGDVQSSVWRQWCGWLPGVSRVYPVSVRVVAAEDPTSPDCSDPGPGRVAALVA